MEEELITTRKVVHGVLDFLDTELKKPSTTAATKESLEVAMQCLETAYGVTLTEKDKEYQLGRSLMDLVASPTPSNVASSNPLTALFGGESGGSSPLAALLGGTGASSPLASLFAGSSVANPLDSLAASNPLAALAQAFPFKFHTGDEYERPPEASEADKMIAEELKNKGNDFMIKENFEEALKDYNKAVELDGNKAAIFCNRSACYIKLGEYDNALRDCQIAAQLEPSYAKAYARMGLAYSCQNQTVDAILCFKKALELEPENESYQTNFESLQQLMMNDLPTVMAQASTSQLIQSILSSCNLGQ